ncbi:MAG TPA: HD domain-containing phosphohydrolase [Anaeromyxobacter sp.]
MTADPRFTGSWSDRAWRRRRLTVDGVIHTLFPEALLEGTPWLELWRDHESRVIVLASRITLALTAVAYVAHWFLVDLPLRLQPLERWATYRFGSATLFAILLAVTLLPAFQRTPLVRLPLIVLAVALGALEAKTVEWQPRIAYTWAFPMTLAPLLFARLSVPGTLAAFGGCLGVQWLYAWRNTAVPTASLVSAATLSAIIAVVVRARQGNDVRAFLTEKREIDAQKKLIETQIELDQVKTNFFTNVSHELRTPLTLILAPLEAMLAAGRAVPRELRTELELMHRNAERLLRHINALLRLSRLDAKREYLKLDEVDPVEMLRSLLDSGRALAEKRHIELRFEPDVPMPRVVIDREKIEQIALNLLGNALRFTDGTEHRPGHVLVRCGVKGALFFFEVEDDGVGIPANEVTKVFDRFHQVPGHASRGGGTGVGLALVKELTEFHMGAVSVRSRLGRGSTFTVELPMDPSIYPPDRLDRRQGGLRPSHERRRPISRPHLELVSATELVRAPPPPAQPAATPPPPRVTVPESRPLVLVVDDNSEMREFLQRQLGPEFRCAVSESADEAQRLAAKEVPDVVVSDLMMPGRSGTDLLHDLRSDPLTRRVPVIFVTAKSDVETKVRNLEEGADDYVSKPFSVVELKARIRSLLARRALERELAEKNEHLSKVNFDLVLSKRQVFLETMEAFALAVDAKDPYTHGHSRRVSILAERISREMGLSEKDVEMVRIAGILHDVGKIGTPESVLAKPGRLEPEEYELFKKHSALGHRIVSAVKELEPVGKAILHHHERFDGNGYPAGLSGQAIPQLSRILAVCDTYDAMTTTRPYRTSLGHRAAVEELARCAGRQLDPDAVRAFLRLYEDAAPTYPAFPSGLRELAGVAFPGVEP